MLAIACLISLAPRAAFGTGQRRHHRNHHRSERRRRYQTRKVPSPTKQTSVASTHRFQQRRNLLVQGLLPGKYTVSVDASGFKKDVKKGVTIEVSTTATIDFTLATGAASETVQVTSDADRPEHNRA